MVSIKLHWRHLRSRYPWLQMVQTWRCWFITAAVILLILYAALAFRKRPAPFFEKDIKELVIGNIQIDFRTGLFFLEEKNDVVLRGSILDSQEMHGQPSHCGQYNATARLCAEWYPYTKLEVSHSMDEHASCDWFVWTSTSRRPGNKHSPVTCFSMANVNWYGGSLLSKQSWPLNIANVPLQPYVSHDLRYNQNITTVFGNVLDWFWISSSGVGIMMDTSIPVKVSINQSGDKRLCIHAINKDSAVLKYKICKADNLRKIHRYVISRMVHLPVSLPNNSVFTYPHWSSNPLYSNPSQDSIFSFAKEILDHSFPRFLFETYDDSISLYKPDYLRKDKYPNLQQVMMHMHGDYGFQNVIAVSPFISTEEKMDKINLIQYTNGKSAIISKNGMKYNMLNLLDNDVYEEFLKKIENLKQLCGLSGLRIIGGELEYFPDGVLTMSEQNSYIDRLLNVSQKLKLAVVSTAVSQSQKYSPLTLLTSQSSSWSNSGGLHGIIPSVLTLGILGYPFFIPNIVGGPGINKKVNSTFTQVENPDKELYIRWLELSAYMPVMMFSFPPWAYDKQVIDLAEAYVKTHKDVVGPLVIKAAREYEISGSPIIRPLWWIDPTDKVLETIDDQYLIGSTLLVAPILNLGQTARNIYIPDGEWQDELTNKAVHGKTWLRNYAIPLDKIATFIRVAAA